MTGTAILVAIIVGLAFALYGWKKRRQASEQAPRIQSEPRPAPVIAPEDELVLRLLQKIKAASGQFYFTTFESRQVFSDGHFL